MKEATLADAIKADYIQLAYLQQTLPILEASKAEFGELITNEVGGRVLDLGRGI